MSWDERVTALASDPTHQEVVMLVRCGLTRSEALGMTRLERHAWLNEYNRQEQEAYQQATASAPAAPSGRTLR